MRTDDGSIVQECLNGKPGAFGILVDKYKAGIYAYVYTELRNFHDAQDVTQEVFLQAYRGLRSLKRWESFSFWLYRIAHNLCRKWVRTQSRRPDSEFIEDQEPETLEVSSLNSHRESQIRQSLQEVLDSLPDTYREVLMLHYFGGMSIKEIARAIGVSPGAIGMRLSRARAQLKEEMVAMMDTAFEGHKLQASFTFRIVEAVKRIKIDPMPRMGGLPWGLSLAAGITIAVLSLSPHLDMLIPVSPPAGSAPPSPATALKNGEIPVDVMEISQMPFMSAMQGDGNSEDSRLKNALLMAPAAEGDTWAAKGDMPASRYMLAAIAVNGKIYTIGGAEEPGGKTIPVPNLEEYDPVADTWTRKADMLTPGEPLAAAVNGKIYVIGGTPIPQFFLNCPVEVYDPATDTWTEKASMRTARRWLATCVLDGKIYAIGGAGSDYSARSTVEAYDPATDKWTTLADMPTRRWGVAAAAVNGKIYAIGGTQGGAPFVGLSTVEEYDPATDTWTRKADMPTARSCLTAAVVNGKVYAIGGSAGNPLSEVEEYDPVTDTWTERASMSNLRYFPSSAVVDNRIYVMGGSSTHYPDVNFIPTVEEYTPPGWSSSVSPISPQGKLPTTWGVMKGSGETR